MNKYSIKNILPWVFLLTISPTFLFPGCSQDKQDRQKRILTIEKVMSAPGLCSPTDILKFKNQYIATELKDNRLAIFNDLDHPKIRYFDPENIGRHFTAPHFLAISPSGSLLISNGWGKSIVEIEDIDGSGWKTFTGPSDDAFNAPHGICVDKDGWIYVGDSRNSRLVRFKDMHGSAWQVFKDIDRKIAYVRQVVCNNGSVWIANTYERIAGLNPGQGGNVLRIDDFNTGKAAVVYEDKKAHITGILPLDGRLLVGRWSRQKNVVAVDLKSGKVFSIEKSNNRLGIPYGFFEDRESHRILNAYFGSLKSNAGGLTILKIK